MRFVPHDRRQMNIFRNVPTESLVKQIVFQFTAQYSLPRMTWVIHQMVIDDVGKIVGWKKSDLRRTWSSVPWHRLQSNRKSNR